MECGGGGNKADFQVSLAGPWADALCPPSCQQRKAALSSQAPPRPAGRRCSGVTVGTLDRVSSGRIWVSSGNWGTNTNPPGKYTHMAGLVHGDPVPQMGWQPRDLARQGWTMPPVCSLLTPAESRLGMKVPLWSSVPRERVETDSAASGLLQSRGGTTLELGLTPSQKARNPARAPQVNFSPKSHPRCVSQCLLGRVPQAPSCSIGLSGSQHFCQDSVIKPYQLLP